MMATPDRMELLKLLADTCSLSQSYEEAENLTLVNLQIDSLDLVEMEMALEDNYQLEFDVDKITPESTLGQVIDTLKPISV